MARFFNLTNLKKTYYYLKRNGVPSAVGAALERIQGAYYSDYTYIRPETGILQAQRETGFKSPIMFSIVVPAFETRKDFLDQLVSSLMEQTYPNWELILADATPGDQVKKQIENYTDARIHYVKLQQNEGISSNTNQGIQKAKGEYIGLLDHDDYLAPDALFEMAKAIENGRKNNMEYGFLYSDEDKCDEKGDTFYDPHFKTDFNLDLFLTNNYICHFLVMKRELMQSLGFRREYDGAQDYDLCLRAVAKLWEREPRVEKVICHIPKVLYHWRCHNDSTAANPQSKRYAYEAGKRALEDFAQKKGWEVTVKELPHVGFYRLEYKGGIFSQRADIAAIGGKEIKKGRITGSIYNEEGQPLYEGLPSIYSGYIHRAVLTQNAAQLDIEKCKINPKILEIIETFKQQTASNACETKKIQQKALCEFLIEQDYRLYWDPQWRV